MKLLLLLPLLCLFLPCLAQQTPPMRPQNPSPMVEYTRPHHRIPLDSVLDTALRVDLPGGFAAKWYAPEKAKAASSVDLLIHFHGDSRVAQYAVDRQDKPWLLFHVHWGNGSSAYSRPVQTIGANAFLDTVLATVKKELPGARIARVWLSGWSAGYGAIRAILGEEEAAARVDGILLLDGLHCSYVPEGKLMAEGAGLDSTQMQPFLRWARLAATGEKSMLITHSSVFPGTFASTTETADYLLQSLGIRRRSELAEGPLGMQQTSQAVQGRLRILSFAGNSAPDHVDHYHGLGWFLGFE